ncbi:MAG: FMN-binding protein [Oscillospiraceae bacterium]|nr:FMN-binding protein [Oscillospiraceae bacterium]
MTPLWLAVKRRASAWLPGQPGQPWRPWRLWRSALPWQPGLLGLLATLLLMLPACGAADTALTEAEGAAVSSICGVAASALEDISREVLTQELSGKFPAVDKVYRHQDQDQDLYVFVVSPVAYNGPVAMVLAIDGETGKSVGLQILSHNETPHYVRDMESAWFTRRFAGKPAELYLRLARLKANSEQDIVAITGATVTTEGVINGVNAAFGVYQEAVLGRIAGDVPYMVRFEPAEGDGPTETGSLAIRAHGLVLAEIGMGELKELPAVKRTMSIHSSAGTTQHVFRGTLLSHVLDLADPSFAERFGWVLAVGVDDYLSHISMEEVLAENSVYIMYEDNGEPLPKKNGEPGALRIVVLDDVFGQRFTNYLLEIVLENEDALG